MPRALWLANTSSHTSHLNAPVSSSSAPAPVGRSSLSRLLASLDGELDDEEVSSLESAFPVGRSALDWLLSSLEAFPVVTRRSPDLLRPASSPGITPDFLATFLRGGLFRPLSTRSSPGITPDFLAVLCGGLGSSI